MQKGIIYAAFCETKKKYYIGQTTKPLSVRRDQHISQAVKNPNTYFHRALRKYEFIFNLIEEIESENLFDDLNEREKYWIDFYKTMNKQFGYNLQKGGRKSIYCTNKLKQHSQQTKDKISASLSGEKNVMFGISIYTKWIEKYGIEEANRRKESHSNSLKISNAGEKNGMYGKKQSENMKKVLSEKSKKRIRKKHSENTKKLMSEKAKNRIRKNSAEYREIDYELLKKLVSEDLSITEISRRLNVSYYIAKMRIKNLKTERK